MYKDIINNMFIKSYSFNLSLLYNITKSLISLKIDFNKEVTLNKVINF